MYVLDTLCDIKSIQLPTFSLYTLGDIHLYLVYFNQNSTELILKYIFIKSFGMHTTLCSNG